MPQLLHPEKCFRLFGNNSTVILGSTVLVSWSISATWSKQIKNVKESGILPFFLFVFWAFCTDFVFRQENPYGLAKLSYFQVWRWCVRFLHLYEYGSRHCSKSQNNEFPLNNFDWTKKEWKARQIQIEKSSTGKRNGIKPKTAKNRIRKNGIKEVRFNVIRKQLI